MKSCPQCLSELVLDPERARDMLSVIVARGYYLARPDGGAPFAAGPACTLLRVRPESSLVFIGDDGFLEAHVEGHDHRAVPPLSCRDLDGRELFRVERYPAAVDALVAFGADGASLGTYLRRPGVAHAVIDVRDETSAPVAALRAGSDVVGGGYQLVETGGSAVASVGFTDVETDGWVDDQWSLQPLVDPEELPIRPLAAVALLLAGKVLLGRAAALHLQPRSRLSSDDSLDEG
jgi:hypothetical protein